MTNPNDAEASLIPAGPQATSKGEWVVVEELSSDGVMDRFVRKPGFELELSDWDEPSAAAWASYLNAQERELVDLRAQVGALDSWNAMAKELEALRTAQGAAALVLESTEFKLGEALKLAELADEVALIFRQYRGETGAMIHVDGWLARYDAASLQHK